MKTQYPNSLRKSKYIQVLNGEYMRKYPEFSPEQINLYVSGIVDAISNQIEEFESHDGMLFIVNNLLALNKISEMEEEGKSQTILQLFAYLGKMGKKLMEEIMRDDCLEQRIPFPEAHKGLYMECVSEMTAEAIDAICSLTKAKLIASKAEEKGGKVAGESKPREVKGSSSFVERVGGKDRSETRRGFADRETEERSKKVRFTKEVGCS
jgi:hypothetical protein